MRDLFDEYPDAIKPGWNKTHYTDGFIIAALAQGTGICEGDLDEVTYDDKKGLTVKLRIPVTHIKFDIVVGGNKT
jgi:hypothetical protein